MLIVMDSAATADDVRRVVEAVQSLGFQAHPIPGAQRTAISVTGNRGSVESASFENLPGVAEGHSGHRPLQARLPGSEEGGHRRFGRGRAGRRRAGRGRRGTVRDRIREAGALAFSSHDVVPGGGVLEFVC